MSRARAAVVTGVSSGIGRAVAAELLKGGWRVFGSVRKDSDAQAAQADLGERFTPLVFDVTDDAGVAAGAETVRKALGDETLAGLVNNAGIAVAGPVQEIPLDEVRRQFEVNVIGVLRVTQAFLPLLGARPDATGKPGRIVNMSSVAGRIASPFLSPYAMSKHALEALTDATRRELALYGVDAVAIGPGAIKTPIWDKAEDLDVEAYTDGPYGPLLERLKKAFVEVGQEGLPAEAVGRLTRRVLEADRPAPRHAILRNKFMLWTLPNLLPKRMVDKALARRFGIDA